MARFDFTPVGAERIHFLAGRPVSLRQRVSDGRVQHLSLRARRRRRSRRSATPRLASSARCRSAATSCSCFATPASGSSQRGSTPRPIADASPITFLGERLVCRASSGAKLECRVADGDPVRVARQAAATRTDCSAACAPESFYPIVQGYKDTGRGRHAREPVGSAAVEPGSPRGSLLAGRRPGRQRAAASRGRVRTLRLARACRVTTRRISTICSVRPRPGARGMSSAPADRRR